LLYVLLGQDNYSVSRFLDGIKQQAGEDTFLSANTVRLDGQQVTIDQLRSVCEAAPLLAERRIVIIEGLLSRFEARGKSARGRKSKRKENQLDEDESFAVYINNTPPSTILVLIDERAGNNNPLLKGISANAQVRSFPLLRGAELRQWVQAQVSAEGGSISPPAVNLLSGLVGGDLWAMSNEVKKLVLFAAGRCIEVEDVNKVVSAASENNVFAMVDAIIRAETGTAERTLQQLLMRGASPTYLLFMLSRQVRLIVRAKVMRSRGEHEPDIQRRLGLTSDYTLRKTLEQAGGYSFDRLKEVYRRLLETDLAIKTGKYNGELAMSILIAELCLSQKVGS